MSRTIFEVHSNLFDDNDWGGEPCVGDEIEHDGKSFFVKKGQNDEAVSMIFPIFASRKFRHGNSVTEIP